MSATFSRVGKDYFELPLESEAALGYSGNAEAGYDNITIGWQGSGGPSIDHQVVLAYATQDIYLGQLGLTPRPVNVTSFNDGHSSPLATLRNTGRIISSSWGYTAGAHYRGVNAFGSLTLGGFDFARFSAESQVSLPMGQDISRDLVVPISAYIDSTVSQLWLPASTCREFESVFGLVWDDPTQLYLLNSTQHDKLIAQNASVKFQLGNSSTQSIVLPYAAFDLTASYPLLGGNADPNTSSYYFPLKRAQNESQYVLGRVFLQEAYVIMDYDRQNFTIGQALWPSADVQPNLVTIFPPGNDTAAGHRNMATAIIIGISVAVAVVVLSITCSTVLCFVKKRKRKEDLRKQQAERAAAIAREQHEREIAKLKPELDGWNTAVGRLNLASYERQELDSADAEIAPRQAVEMDAKSPSRYELECFPTREKSGLPNNDLHLGIGQKGCPLGGK